MKPVALLVFFIAMNIYIITAQSPDHCVSLMRESPYSFSMFGTREHKPSQDSSSKRIELSGPALHVVIEYLGGDTLLVYVENRDGERIWLRLLEDGTTLLADRLKPLKEQQRIYLISQFPPGVYTIRIQKGTHLIEQHITKLK
jgi:hypothetical protein